MDNPIERILKIHTLSYLSRVMDTSSWIWHKWATSPESISFKNIDKLRTKNLISADEYDLMVLNRDKYLISIKGDRGKHLKNG